MPTINIGVFQLKGANAQQLSNIIDGYRLARTGAEAERGTSASQNLAVDVTHGERGVRRK